MLVIFVVLFMHSISLLYCQSKLIFNSTLKKKYVQTLETDF